MSDIRITILDADGVDSFGLDREPAWLVAVAAQLDEDAAADRRRMDDAYCRLWDAVARLTGETR